MVCELLPLLPSYFRLATEIISGRWKNFRRPADSNQLIGIDADSRPEGAMEFDFPIVHHARLAIEDLANVTVHKAEPDLLLENGRRVPLGREALFKSNWLLFEFTTI